MREILFRGKNFDGNWVEGDLVQGKDYGGERMCYIMKSVTCLIFDDYSYDEVDPETVSEFTGLRDKNGKRIFEGDIIKARPFLPPFEVVYENVELKIRNKYGNILLPQQEAIIWTEAQVIGNKWDNPELLEG